MQQRDWLADRGWVDGCGFRPLEHLQIGDRDLDLVDSFCRFAAGLAIEPVRHNDTWFCLIVDGLVKAICRPVVGADHQLHLGRALLAQPILGVANDFSAETLMPARFRHREVMEPATVAVIADHHTCGNAIAVFADEYLGLRRGARAGNVRHGVVPWPDQAAGGPKLNHRCDISILDRSY